VFPFIKVVKEGSILRLSLDSKRMSISVTMLKATINVKAKLDYALSGASRLKYRGNTTIGKHVVSGASRASRIVADQGKKYEDSTLCFSRKFGTEATTTTRVVIDVEGVLRYCGRFSDGACTYAEDVLKAVLAENEGTVKMLQHDGCRIVWRKAS
jgi:hypothetical protein